MPGGKKDPLHTHIIYFPPNSGGHYFIDETNFVDEEGGAHTCKQCVQSSLRPHHTSPQPRTPRSAAGTGQAPPAAHMALVA